MTLQNSSSVYDFDVLLSNKKCIKMREFEGKVLLIVNTASQCGYTPQYKGLQSLYERHKDQGFEVLAFPSNEFGAQEPGTDDQIASFCEMNFQTRFPLFAKSVVKGPGIHPLFKFLTETANPKHTGEIDWNFEKFLISKEGQLLMRFKSGVNPTDSDLIRAIETALG